MACSLRMRVGGTLLLLEQRTRRATGCPATSARSARLHELPWLDPAVQYAADDGQGLLEGVE
jgi:hypothetical protein